MMREWLSGVRSGFDFAVRSIRRAPGFVLAVVLLLSLGLGANATMFTVIDRLVIRAPRHLRDAGRLRRLYVQRRVGGTLTTTESFTLPDVKDLEELSPFADMAAWMGASSMTLGDGESTEKVPGVLASWKLFPMLGVGAERGRFFGQEDDRVGAPKTAVISHELWVRRYGSDPDVIGRRIHVGDDRYEVIGVAPEGFTGADLLPADLWLPLIPASVATQGPDWLESRRWWILDVAARLAPGAGDGAAAEAATAAHRAARADSKGYDPQARILLAPILRARGPDPAADAPISWWLAGMSLIVLLVACANVANLFLARSVRLRRELAVRLALGSSRSRLAAHFLTESLVLALLAGACAVGIAVAGGSALHRLLLPDMAFGSLIDPRLIGFTAIAACATALVAGIAPALLASRPQVVPALCSTGARTSEGGGRRLRRLLVVAQTALSTALLVGSGLFTASLRRARTSDIGFDPAHTAYVQVEIGDGDTEGVSARTRRLQIYSALEEQLPRIAGVLSAARAVTVPFGPKLTLPVALSSGDSLPRFAAGPPGVSAAAPGYFHLLGQNVLRGREFEGSDLDDGTVPVAVVNDALAKRMWPHQDPLAQCLRIGGSGADCARIVGVVETGVVQQIGEEPQMMVWVPIERGAIKGVGGVAVRTTGSPDALARDIRTFIQSRWPDVRFVTVRPLGDDLDRQLRPWKLGASLFSIFGLLALLVAAIGAYSLLAFDVAQRQFELGIRMALGATRRTLVGDVFRTGVLLALAGVLAGLGAAALLAPKLQPLLFHTSPRDPIAFLIAGAGLMVASTLAAWAPASRATRVDPAESLRSV